MKMKEFAIHAVGWALSTNAIHTYFGAGALWGIWYAVRETAGRPAAVGVVSALILMGIIHARTRR